MISEREGIGKIKIRRFKKGEFTNSVLGQKTESLKKSGPKEVEEVMIDILDFKNIDIMDVLKVIAKKSNLNILFSYANADDNGRAINQKIEIFCQTNPRKYKVVKSLGQLRYLSAMKYVDILIGNTSSGIIEAASFQKPVVNIGNRQKGRLQSGNVIDCSIKVLQMAISKALSKDFYNTCKAVINMYGEGNASNIIVDKLLI